MEREVITGMPLEENAISIVLLSLCLDPPLSIVSLYMKLGSPSFWVTLLFF